MLKFIFFSIVFFTGLLSASPNTIKYENKILLKILKKRTGTDHMTELQLHKDIKKELKETGKFFSGILAGPEKPETYVYVGRVNSCRGGSCFKGDESGSKPFEYFDYFILFDAESRIQDVKVFNYQATHGYEITAPGWLRQYRGYNGRDTLRVGKEIDSISGATISVDAITKDIQNKTKLLKQILSAQ